MSIRIKRCIISGVLIIELCVIYRLQVLTNYSRKHDYVLFRTNYSDCFNLYVLFRKTFKINKVIKGISKGTQGNARFASLLISYHLNKR